MKKQFSDAFPRIFNFIESMVTNGFSTVYLDEKTLSFVFESNFTDCGMHYLFGRKWMPELNVHDSFNGVACTRTPVMMHIQIEDVEVKQFPILYEFKKSNFFGNEFHAVSNVKVRGEISSRNSADLVEFIKSETSVTFSLILDIIGWRKESNDSFM